MLYHNKVKPITDDEIRLLIFEEDCAENYGYNKIKLQSGREITYTSMVRPECLEQYKNGKVTIKNSIELKEIIDIEYFFETERSQEYFKLFIENESSKELKRVKLLREKSPLNKIISPNKEMTSLELICQENHEKNKK